MRPDPGTPLAANDHLDPGWDGRVLAELAQIADVLDEVEAALVAVLARFAGYGDRFRAALDAGRITDPRDSCHQVWFELHEDLIATLGITRH